MNKANIPYRHATSAFEVDPSFFLNLGIKVVLCDLDNTLAFYGSSAPTPECRAWVCKMKNAGIEVYICSNGLGKRVAKFGAALNVPCAFFMRKPNPKPLLSLLKEKGWNKEEVILIGDQIQTDVLAGNRAGIKVLLTEPLGKKEPPWTKWNRLFDKPKRRKLNKKGMLISWRVKENEQA